MRLKAGDPQANGLCVLLNGKRLRDCIEADDEEGWAVIHERHWQTGERIEDAEGPQGYRAMTVRGRVEFAPASVQAQAPEDAIRPKDA